MTLYRLTVWRDGRLWCQIDADTPWAREAMSDVAARFAADDGYRLELAVATEERRLLSAQGGRIDVIAREPLLQPLALDAL